MGGGCAVLVSGGRSGMLCFVVFGVVISAATGWLAGLSFCTTVCSLRASFHQMAAETPAPTRSSNTRASTRRLADRLPGWPGREARTAHGSRQRTAQRECRHQERHPAARAQETLARRRLLGHHGQRLAPGTGHGNGHTDSPGRYRQDPGLVRRHVGCIALGDREGADDPREVALPVLHRYSQFTLG